MLTSIELTVTDFYFYLVILYAINYILHLFTNSHYLRHYLHHYLNHSPSLCPSYSIIFSINISIILHHCFHHYFHHSLNDYHQLSPSLSPSFSITIWITHVQLRYQSIIFGDIHTPELERLDKKCTTLGHQLTIIRFFYQRHVPLSQYRLKKNKIR